MIAVVCNAAPVLQAAEQELDEAAALRLPKPMGGDQQSGFHDAGSCWRRERRAPPSINGSYDFHWICQIVDLPRQMKDRTPSRIRGEGSRLFMFLPCHPKCRTHSELFKLGQGV